MSTEDTAPAWTPRDGMALVLRTCRADMTACGGFTWPESGPVEAPDWRPTAECGHGLHGLLWGAGAAALTDSSDDARWLVVEVAENDCVDLHGKVKFPRGTVIYVGGRDEAVALVQQHAPVGTPVIYGTATAGNYGTATAGDGGTATAGNYGTATAGDGGTATAGDDGTATAGRCGTATAGYHGTATAGNYGVIAILYHDGNQYRRAVSEVGQGGIEPDVAYVVRDGVLVRADAVAHIT